MEHPKHICIHTLKLVALDAIATKKLDINVQEINQAIVVLASNDLTQLVTLTNVIAGIDALECQIKSLHYAYDLGGIDAQQMSLVADYQYGIAKLTMYKDLYHG